MEEQRKIPPVHSNSSQLANMGIFDIDDKIAALKGDLSVVTIENLMQLIGYSRLSGDLYLSTPSNQACFIVRNGELVFSYLKFNDTMVGQRLISDGHITEENLRACLEIYNEKNGKLRLGEILVLKKLVSNSVLVQVLKEQVKDCFFTVLKWKEGIFSFFENELPPNEDIMLSERLDHLVLECTVALDKRRNEEKR